MDGWCPPRREIPPTAEAARRRRERRRIRRRGIALRRADSDLDRGRCHPRGRAVGGCANRRGNRNTLVLRDISDAPGAWGGGPGGRTDSVFRRGGGGSTRGH